MPPGLSAGRLDSWLWTSLRDAAAVGAIGLLLAIPLLGFETIPATEGLALQTRWLSVVQATIAVFVGRFGLSCVMRLTPKLQAPKVLGSMRSWRSLESGFVIAVLGIALILPFVANRYVLDVAILVLTYIMLGWGLNIVVGLAGLLDLGYVAFYAVGAYSFGLMANHWGMTFWECLPLAGAMAALFGLLLGFPVLRLRGDYLAIVTLGFGEIIRIVIKNWSSLTNGPNGISGIPRPTFFGLSFTAAPKNATESFHQFFGIAFDATHRLVFLYFIILILALLTNFFAVRIRKLPIGRAWEALREDEIACRSLGINPTTVKLTAFTIGAMFGGFAGCFFATRQGFISPESFTFIESAIILAIVVLGGRGSQVGVVIAAIVLIGGPELVRGLQDYRMLAFGALMVAITIWRPAGVIAFREPSVRLHPRSAILAERP